MKGIGLSIGAPRAHRWWPAAAVYAADFVSNRYMRNGLDIPANQAFSINRASGKMALDLAGNWHAFPPGVPARTNRGLLIEPAETYYPANAALSGASTGIVGAGGNLPAGWTTWWWTKLEVVSIGLHQGVGVITLDLTLDNTGDGSLTNAGIILATEATVQGEFWTAGLYGETVGVFGDDTCANPANRMQMQERDGANNLVSSPGGNFNNFDAGDLSTRRSVTKEIATANAAFVRLLIRWDNVQPGEYMHRRVALKLPTLTKSQTISTPMVTTGAGVVKRATDATVVHLPSGMFDVTLSLANGAKKTLAGVSGDVNLPLNLGEPIVTAVALPV